MALNDNTRGALMMTAGMMAFVTNDALMKSLLADLPFFQTIFLRSLGGFIGLLLLSRWLGPIRFDVSRRDRGILVLRSVADIFSTFLYLFALSQMPLPNITAILQALPLVMTLAAALFLGESIGWRRVAAVIIGFAGVLLIVRPGAEGFGWPALLALAAVGCVAVRDISTRMFSARVTSMTAAVTLVGFLMVASGICSIFTEWRPLSGRHMVELLSAVVCVSAGYVLIVEAMRSGEMSVVAPFRYTGLLWALVLGYFVFGFFPELPSLVGAALIVGAGVFTFYREMVVRRQEGEGAASVRR